MKTGSTSQRPFRKRVASFSTLVRAIGLRAAFDFSRQSRRAARGEIQSFSLWPKQLLYPVLVRAGTSDLDVFCQVFLEEQYSCVKNLGNVEFIIDCGANVGYASAYLLSRFPDARLIAVEPDDGNFETASLNLAPYGDRVKLVHAGVWSSRTGLLIRDTPYRDGRQSSRQVYECEPDRPGCILGVDMPSLMAEAGSSRVSLLKIDIEGAEAVVFSPRSSCSEWLPLVDALVIELHDDSTFGPCTPIFYEAIREQSFAVDTSGELTVCLRT